METESIIEKELLRKPPRRIVNRNGKWGSIIPWLFLLLPHFWIAVIAPFVWVALVCNTFCAQPMPAKVVKHQTGHYKGHTTYTVDYAIDLNNKITKSSASVGLDQYQSLKDGDKLTVYGLPWLPWFAPRLVKDSNLPLFALAFLTFWCLIWCGITFSIVYAMLIQPLRSRFLTQNGTALPATITDIKVSKGRNGSTYKVLYEYEAKAIDKKNGKTVNRKFQGKMTVRQGDYKEADALRGHQVSVLVNEKKPQESILYRFGSYRVVS